MTSSIYSLPEMAYTKLGIVTILVGRHAFFPFLDESWIFGAQE